MKIHLQTLQHQRDALNALLEAMPPVDENKNLSTKGNPYANPLLEEAGQPKKFIDIRMETGTGKTYVYTRAMYELHKKFGLFKFIILVPSLAIKAGTKNFIDSDYARQHFSQFFPNKKVKLNLINNGDFSKKKGRNNIPTGLTEFCQATHNDRNTIQCLLISDKGFLDSLTYKLFKEDYDRTILSSFNCPADAIAETQPILLIDEPHRFKTEGQTYKNVQERLKPQMIVRFGATFPEIEVGRGKNKHKVTQYYRGKPQFDLNAREAFNQDLVKGIAVHFPNMPEDATIYTVTEVNKNKLVLRNGHKQWQFAKREDLSSLHFEGIYLDYDGDAQKPCLSNGVELSKGKKLIAGTFSNSYQELLIQGALDAHFEEEIKNFHRFERGEGYRVKINALFFIDSVDSYRDADGWLKQTFEELLQKKLDALLQSYPSGEYHDFLQATRRNIALAHGGYFAKDWGLSDERLTAEERKDILHKERTLPFKKDDGTWNIRRFFFSKWALREGWDNPNVFTICKLRSSGSDISKLQEVGRGLRLPVDEQGNRLNGEWFLNYHIGWDEKDFATKLKGEIAANSGLALNENELTKGMIKIVCEASSLSEDDLLQDLQDQGIITRSNKFLPGGFDKLVNLYPILQNRLKSGKILDKKEKAPKVKLQRANWKKIRHIWEKISRRYMLQFANLPGGEETVEHLLTKVLEDEDIFQQNYTTETIQTLQKNNDDLELTTTSRDLANDSQLGILSYNVFVEKLAYRTAIPIQTIHKILWTRLQKMSDEIKVKQRISDTEQLKKCVNAKLNGVSLQKIVIQWERKFAEIFATLYHYKPLDYTASSTVFKNGKFVEEISAGLLGTNVSSGISTNDDESNLYERPFYNDSSIELEIEQLGKGLEEVVVFGKLPKKAIKIPLYTGGTTTPDFIYALRDKNDVVQLALFVEAKSEDLRDREKTRVKAQENYFKMIDPNLSWKMITKADDVREALKNL